MIRRTDKEDIQKKDMSGYIRKIYTYSIKLRGSSVDEIITELQKWKEVHPDVLTTEYIQDSEGYTYIQYTVYETDKERERRLATEESRRLKVEKLKLENDRKEYERLKKIFDSDEITPDTKNR